MKKFDKRPFSSFNWAIGGIINALREESHMRFHFIFAVIVIIASFVLGLNRFEWFAVIFAILIVILAETVNTLIERVCDRITVLNDINIKKIKDLSAGMVLIAVIGAFVIGYVVFYPHLKSLWSIRLKLVPYHIVILVSLMTVLALVVIIKAVVSPDKEPLYGGMPSGHAAIAFSLWTLIVLRTNSFIISIAALLVALMVVESRLSLGIHKVSEIVAGMLLGVTISYAVYFIFNI